MIHLWRLRGGQSGQEESHLNRQTQCEQKTSPDPGVCPWTTKDDSDHFCNTNYDYGKSLQILCTI